MLKIMEGEKPLLGFGHYRSLAARVRAGGKLGRGALRQVEMRKEDSGST
jgi:hypothetical protein